MRTVSVSSQQVHYCYNRPQPHRLDTSATATRAGKEQIVIRTSMSVQAAPVKMEEPVMMASMDSHALARHSGRAHSAKSPNKVPVKQQTNLFRDWAVMGKGV